MLCFTLPPTNSPQRCNLIGPENHEACTWYPWISLLSLIFGINPSPCTWRLWLPIISMYQCQYCQDWTCQINRCVYPLDHEGLSRSFIHFLGLIPAAWVIAQDQMSKLSLALHQTDQSHLLDGHCSISHDALSLIKQSVPQAEHPNGHAIQSLRSMGFRLLSHIGGWAINCQNLTTFIVRALPPGNWSLAQKKNWDLIKNFFSLAQIRALYSGPADLLLSQSCRQHQAENFIQSIVHANLFPPCEASQGSQLWGTDGDDSWWYSLLSSTPK